MLDRETILKCLQDAKMNYAIYMAKTNKDEVRYGMCRFIRKELDKYMIEHDEERISYKVIQKYIPEFNWKTMSGDDRLYWWPMEDFRIRLKKFDELIERYMNVKH